MKAIDIKADSSGRTACNVKVVGEREFFIMPIAGIPENMERKSAAEICECGWKYELDLEMAKDDLYDLPLFDGEYISAHHGYVFVRAKAKKMRRASSWKTAFLWNTLTPPSSLWMTN